MINRSKTCVDYQNKLNPEPLIPTQIPDLPFNQVALDRFEFESKQYILVVDYYYSKFIEVCELKDVRSRTKIDALKSIFSIHGILEGRRSDNASFLVSIEFKSFCFDDGVNQTTSSLRFARAKSEAERAVQTVKKNCGRKRRTNIWLC